jgi:hypothetical protein
MEKIPTGVVEMRWEDDRSSDYHVWLKWDGNSVDSNAMGTGDIIHGFAVRPAAAESLPRFERPVPQPHYIELSPCKYDFPAFRQCLTDETAKYAVPGGVYTGEKCKDFIDRLVETCKDRSKGCTVPN